MRGTSSSVTAKDLEACGIRKGSFQDMMDAFDALSLPATEGGETIFYDLTEVFEGLAVGFLLDEDEPPGPRKRRN
jgi:hypothetical protein